MPIRMFDPDTGKEIILPEHLKPSKQKTLLLDILRNLKYIRNKMQDLLKALKEDFPEKTRRQVIFKRELASIFVHMEKFYNDLLTTISYSIRLMDKILGGDVGHKEMLAELKKGFSDAGFTGKTSRLSQAIDHYKEQLKLEDVEDQDLVREIKLSINNMRKYGMVNEEGDIVSRPGIIKSDPRDSINSSILGGLRKIGMKLVELDRDIKTLCE